MRNTPSHDHSLQDIGALETRARRRWSKQEKLAIIQQTYAAGQSVSMVASHYGINTNLLFLWRRQYEQGLLIPLKLGEPGVPLELFTDVLRQLCELQQLLGKKSHEAEILKLTLEYDRQARMRMLGARIGMLRSKHG
ncbi:MAG: transposase [Comamonas sp.]